LIEALASGPEAPWATWSRGKPITARQLSKRLGDFGIGPKSIRIGSRVVKGYELSQFTDAFTRYLPDTPAESVTPLQASEYVGFDYSLSVTSDKNVADAEQDKFSDSSICSVVTDDALLAAADDHWEEDL